jgi:hydroxymethylglutaryl-CoA lyase
MGFGNPYGDPWHPDIAIQWSERLQKELDIQIIALSDTIGIAKPEIISSLFNALIPALPDVEFGAHLHTTPLTWKEKIDAAWTAGCRRFDGAIKGYGGCPMADDDLTGNMPTENLLSYFTENQIEHGINLPEFSKAMHIAGEIFPLH